MAVVYKDFLDEAKSLLSGASSEIGFRNSMSRAYYSLYHAAVEYADEVHVPPVSSQSGPVHKNLRAFYTDGLYSDKALQSKMKRVGYSLKVLHEGRCKADYELSASVPAIDADVHLQRCELNVKLVEELRAARAA
ncbi:hypothetical protein I5P84_00265 [Pseudomonas mosselii]|uniref:hypothetical protein n=1 Tax=Pseudomonas mosselii TaxID=78327 RepID=UPI0018D87885|nr:hypothetical protein [Pseudomonas mosselii]MBH3307885.1 hypothetical protein [Pseudomonas mosselii]MBH3323035.1 hypothetical protein [Pseudomonas mosselii]